MGEIIAERYVEVLLLMPSCAPLRRMAQVQKNCFFCIYYVYCFFLWWHSETVAFQQRHFICSWLLIQYTLARKHWRIYIKQSCWGHTLWDNDAFLAAAISLAEPHQGRKMFSCLLAWSFTTWIAFLTGHDSCDSLPCYEVITNVLWAWE